VKETSMQNLKNRSSTISEIWELKVDGSHSKTQG